MSKQKVGKVPIKPVERKIAALAAVAHPGPAARRQLRRLLPLAADTDQLIDMAVRHGLSGMFYKNFLKACLLETLAPHQQEKLRRVYYATVGCNLLLIRGAVPGAVGGNVLVFPAVKARS